MAQTNEPLLSVKGLKQYFPVSKKFTVRAVDNISFDIYPGETYGLVGESGSGKSTTGRSIIRLYDPTEGTILFNGEDISKKLTAKQEKMLRSDMQMVFQDPMTGTATTMSIEENMAIAARRGQSRGLSWGITKKERDVYREMLATLDLGLEDLSLIHI